MSFGIVTPISSRVASTRRATRSAVPTCLPISTPISTSHPGNGLVSRVSARSRSARASAVSARRMAACCRSTRAVKRATALRLWLEACCCRLSASSASSRLFCEMAPLARSCCRRSASRWSRSSWRRSSPSWSRAPARSASTSLRLARASASSAVLRARAVSKSKGSMAISRSPSPTKPPSRKSGPTAATRPATSGRRSTERPATAWPKSGMRGRVVSSVTVAASTAQTRSAGASG